MTVVVALATESGSYMGADSISVDDDGLYASVATLKVRQIGDLLVGFAGNWRAGYLAFKSLERMANPSVEQFVNQFPSDTKEWSLLFIENGKVYEVDDEKSITEARADKDGAYAAIGSGTAVALGALYTDHIDKKSVLNALMATEAHFTGVRSPFTVLELKH
jgi:ATP-dependent protease HslVU (ClpYQ) peptidase subunit